MRNSLSLLAVVIPVSIGATIAYANSATPSGTPLDEAQKTACSAAPMAADIGALKAEIKYLKDRQEIHDVYIRYMRGFDRNDVELLGSAFWSDVQINYGAQSNTFAEFVSRHLHNHLKRFSSWGHLITNESVEIHGDTAHVETYVTGFFRLNDDQVFSDGATIVGVRYIDRLDRRNGEWRIAVREVIPYYWTNDHSSVQTYVKETKSRSECAMGTWDKRDPSYRRPLKRRASAGNAPQCAD